MGLDLEYVRVPTYIHPSIHPYKCMHIYFTRQKRSTDLELVEAEEPCLGVQILDDKRQRVLHAVPFLAEAVQSDGGALWIGRGSVAFIIRV